MRTILIVLLMTLATQVGAGSLTTTMTAFVSDAQVKLEQQKLTGQINGVSLAAKYKFYPDWHLQYEHLSGNGNLNGTIEDFNFNQNLLYGYKTFEVFNSLFSSWDLTYDFGAGFYHKKSKLGNENYEDSQFPVIIVAEMTNTSGVKISFSGLGQLDNLMNNRSGSLSFATPMASNVSLIGKYTNHTSKVNGLQHCGSDYLIGFSIRF